MKGLSSDIHVSENVFSPTCEIYSAHMPFVTRFLPNLSAFINSESSSVNTDTSCVKFPGLLSLHRPLPFRPKFSCDAFSEILSIKSEILSSYVHELRMKSQFPPGPLPPPPPHPTLSLFNPWPWYFTP